MTKEHDFNMQNASRMAKAISNIPDSKFDLFLMMMDAVLLGASMAHQAAQLPPHGTDKKQKED